MNHEGYQQEQARCIMPAKLFAMLLAMLALTGCLTTTPIEVNDNHATLPSFRVAIDLDDEKKSTAAPHTGHAVEFGVIKAKGGSQQSLGAGDLPIVLNGAPFTGPQLVRNDFDFNFGQISYRWRKFFKERKLGLDLSGGLGYSSLNLSVVSATQSDSAYFRNFGVQGGVGMIWRMRPSTSLNVHLAGFASNASTGVSSFGRYELFLAQALGENLELRAGYAKWEMNGNGPLDTSDIRLTFYGPTLDLGLNF